MPDPQIMPGIKKNRAPGPVSDIKISRYLDVSDFHSVIARVFRFTGFYAGPHIGR